MPDPTDTNDATNDPRRPASTPVKGPALGPVEGDGAPTSVPESVPERVPGGGVAPAWSTAEGPSAGSAEVEGLADDDTDPDRSPTDDEESSAPEDVEAVLADEGSPDAAAPARAQAGAFRRGGPSGQRGAPSAPPTEAPARIGPPGTTVLVRHGLMRNVGQFRHELPVVPAPGTRVVVRTERGVELGEVVVGVGEADAPHCLAPDRISGFLRACGGAYPLRTEGTVLRVANAQDLIDFRHLENGAHEEAAFCRQQIRQLNLKMRLVMVEHLLGGERIIFYFTSEHRVDFRELVRRLAAQFRTRIEMRQVGARDEARVAADYERCGQRCCCQQFLKELQPVSMRMAKVQKATLDPSKISGRCGRLMCCLRYEDTTYEELRKKLPRKNIWVRTADKVGRVIETQILTQLVKLALADGTVIAVPNETILERDVPAPPLPPSPEPYVRRGAGGRPGQPAGAPQGGGPSAPPRAGLSTGPGQGRPGRGGGPSQGGPQRPPRQWPAPGPVGAPPDEEPAEGPPAVAWDKLPDIPVRLDASDQAPSGEEDAAAGSVFPAGAANTEPSPRRADRTGEADEVGEPMAGAASSPADESEPAGRDDGDEEAGESPADEASAPGGGASSGGPGQAGRRDGRSRRRRRRGRRRH